MKQNLTSQKGNTGIFIVIVVIAMAFLLVGGEFLIKDFMPLPENTLTSDKDKESSTNPLPKSDPITITNRGCRTEGTNIIGVTTVTVNAQKPGYISLEISNGAGGFAVVGTNEFKNVPISVYELNLPNELGFNNTPWRVKLFEGGVSTNGDFSGGVEKATKDGALTGC